MLTRRPPFLFIFRKFRLILTMLTLVARPLVRLVHAVRAQCASFTLFGTGDSSRTSCRFRPLPLFLFFRRNKIVHALGRSAVLRCSSCLSNALNICSVRQCSFVCDKTRYVGSRVLGF